MIPRRVTAAACAAASLLAGGVRAALPKVDHHLRSVPENLLSGYFSADTPPVLKIESGDTLEVRIVDIRARAPYGINSGRPGSGGTPDAVPRPYSKVIKFDMARNVALFAPGIEVSLKQFQGVMGVAPEKERARSAGN